MVKQDYAIALAVRTDRPAATCRHSGRASFTRRPGCAKDVAEARRWGQMWEVSAARTPSAPRAAATPAPLRRHKYDPQARVEGVDSFCMRAFLAARARGLHVAVNVAFHSPLPSSRAAYSTLKFAERAARRRRRQGRLELGDGAAGRDGAWGLGAEDEPRHGWFRKRASGKHSRRLAFRDAGVVRPATTPDSSREGDARAHSTSAARLEQRRSTTRRSSGTPRHRQISAPPTNLAQRYDRASA